ncbi:glycerol-3-phosphate dehydrogenase/oxidase [Phytohabitans houttuyneae]|uniref:Glycerol-3-phosphate dehydrogenase n=1 Tax=Phytohabitans houttuyneae TaxID=1076126 RepID=A0A6V8K240_9ACTN|nr:glycerol-3-phosphate dehydrogenase/oxidase [Phytohabitans houttuyneae]GFJ76431.1 glycerol-3-phosphate dehydrogenase [Phytohabitans houttuyneae]
MSQDHKRGTQPHHLDAASRERDLTALAGGEVLDVLVVGLGATGAGVALDAASRGLRVAAIDAHDLAFGTSRWSSKLIHGGLRYLAKLELGIAYESAVERHILMTRTAPHLIRALPMLWPRSGPRAVTALTAAAIAGGDLLRMAAGTPRRVLPRPRLVGTAETRALALGLRSGLRGGIVSWDGQLCDDARLVIGLARAAAGEGARIVTRCRALALAGDGAEVRDELTGSTFEIRARAVVNATGVWAGTLAPGVQVRPSLGTHIILPQDALGGLTVGLMVPVPGTVGRAVMALPQADGLVYAGLTDKPLDGPVPDVPEPPEADIVFLLDVLNTVLDRPLRRVDVLGAYAGLRPLLSGRSERSGQASGNSTDTAELSRRHALLTGPDGVMTIVGGKLTTYRRMAADTIDAVVRRTGLPAGPCRTRSLPLPGAGSPQHLAQVRAPRRLVARYGTEAPQVLAEAASQPWLLKPVAETSPVLGAELLWAVRHEGALDIDDLLDRRTRIGLVAANRAAALPTADHVLSYARSTT